MSRPSAMGAIALGSIVLGTLVAVYSMFDWDARQYYFAQTRATTPVVTFYVAEFIAIFLLLLGFYAAYRDLGMRASTSPFSSLLGIIGSAVSDPKLRRVALFATAVYAVVYAFASSVLVYQPSVDFASTYGTTGAATWSPFPCCGSTGAFPELILYFPSAHFSFQLVPLSVLLLFIVPPLVGLNLSIALFSVRKTVAKVTGRWMVACGAAVGLFTACPTCAGIFLAESVGGFGAAAISVALAPYQLLFILVSIPLLVTMPFFFAVRVRRAWAPVAQQGISQGVGPLKPGNR